MILEVCWDNLWALSFGPSLFHGHGSWLVCEVALIKEHKICKNNQRDGYYESHIQSKNRTEATPTANNGQRRGIETHSSVEKKHVKSVGIPSQDNSEGTAVQSQTFSFEFVPIPKPYPSVATYAHPCPPMLFKLRPCIQKLCNVY
jgi:hypothetical protein